MKDMYGKQVNNEHILVEGDNWGEVALFFKAIDNKPVLMVRWGIGIMDKCTVGHLKLHAERIKDRDNVPDWLHKYFEESAERLDNVKIEDLMLVEGINVEIVNKFINEGHEAIEYLQDDETQIPIAIFPDKEIVGGY